MVQEFPPKQLGLWKIPRARIEERSVERPESVFAKDSDYSALNADVRGWNYDWGHLGIGWL